MQAFVPFSVVLSSKSLATDCTDKWSLVSVGAQVGSKIVGARESFGTQVALERGRVLLRALVGSCLLAILILRVS